MEDENCDRKLTSDLKKTAQDFPSDIFFHISILYLLLSLLVQFIRNGKMLLNQSEEKIGNN